MKSFWHDRRGRFMTLTNYWWLLIWLFTGGLFLAYFAPKQVQSTTGEIKRHWMLIPSIVLIIPYVIWAGFRTDNWGDTYAYREMFEEAPSSLSGLLSYVQSADKDQGFSAFTVLIKSVFGNSDVAFFIVIALIQLFCLIYVYRKYSCNLWLSIFIFVASTDYMSWMHNGIRQFLAVGITSIAMILTVKKKHLLAIILILIAATIHASALIMLPGIFIIQGKAWNKKTLLALIAALIVILMIDRFTDFLDLLLADTQYSTAVSTWQQEGDDGTSPFRVLVYAVPLILSLIGYKYIKNADNPVVNLSVNAGICAVGIFAISIFSSGIFIGRLPVYFYVASQGILLPWEIENMFNERSKKLVLIATVICYSAYFYYQMHIAWGII